MAADSSRTELLAQQFEELLQVCTPAQRDVICKAAAQARSGVMDSETGACGGGSTRRLQEIDVPLTHGFARLVLNRTIDDMHRTVNRLYDALDAAKE
eukprot:s582_g23.t1